mgnify:CR=1 FL=1
MPKGNLLKNKFIHVYSKLIIIIVKHLHKSWPLFKYVRRLLRTGVRVPLIYDTIFIFLVKKKEHHLSPMSASRLLVALAPAEKFLKFLESLRKYAKTEKFNIVVGPLITLVNPHAIKDSIR